LAMGKATVATLRWSQFSPMLIGAVVILALVAVLLWAQRQGSSYQPDVRPQTREQQRAVKIAEYVANRTEVLSSLLALIKAEQWTDACALVTQYDGVFAAELTMVRETIEAHLGGARCSNQ